MTDSDEITPGGFMPVTAGTITDDQIADLRGNLPGDTEMAIICDRALGRTIDWDDWHISACDDARACQRAAEMTIAVARAECARVLNTCEAQVALDARG